MYSFLLHKALLGDESIKALTVLISSLDIYCETFVISLSRSSSLDASNFVSPKASFIIFQGEKNPKYDCITSFQMSFGVGYNIYKVNSAWRRHGRRE